MDALPLHFRTLRFFGLWYETKQHWLVKYIWQPLTINCMVIFAISLLGALLVYRDNVNDFAECLFLSLTYFGLCFKLLNWLCRRDVMNDLLNEFRVEICHPRDDHERNWLGGYERIVAIVFHLHIGVAQFNNFVFSVAPLLSMAAGNEDIFLPFKTYEIHDKRDSLYYWATYAFQVVSDTIGVFVNVTLDTVLAGFLLLTCAQIDMCCHRFAIASSVNQIRQAIKDCVIHQLLVWRIVRKLEAFFMRVVLPLMLLSLITFCTSVYNLSKVNIRSVESLAFVIYLICLLCQLCCYCWFGNELKLKSVAICDTIYNSDWTALLPLDRKSLYCIMLSCQREMSISFHGLCTISLEIFVWVLKTSYTAYNLLKTVETK